MRERQIRLTELIGEAALHQAHGDPRVVRDQLRALAAVDGPPVVYVLPSLCVPPSSGPATILQFAALPGLGAVYLPGLSGGVCLTGPARHRQPYQGIRAAPGIGAAPAASAHLIREIAAA